MNMRAAYNVCLSGDGAFAALSGTRAVLFSMRPLRKVAEYKPFQYTGNISLDGNGRRLAVRDTQGRSCVIDVLSGGYLWVDNKARGEGKVMYSVCGQWLVETANSIILVRRGDTGVVEHEHARNDEIVDRVSVSAKNNVWGFTHMPVVARGENWADPPYVTCWSWPINNQLAKIHPGIRTVSAFALAPDGERFVVAGDSIDKAGECIYVMSLQGRVMGRIVLGGEHVKSVRWYPDGRHLLAVIGKRTTWEETEMTLTGAIGTLRHIVPDDGPAPLVSVGEYKGGVVVKIAIATMSIISIHACHDPLDIAIDPLGSYMCIASGSGSSTVGPLL